MRKDCISFRQIYDFINEGLSEVQLHQVRSHLAECKSCRDDVEWVTELLASMSTQELPSKKSIPNEAEQQEFDHLVVKYHDRSLTKEEEQKLYAFLITSDVFLEQFKATSKAVHIDMPTEGIPDNTQFDFKSVEARLQECQESEERDTQTAVMKPADLIQKAWSFIQLQFRDISHALSFLAVCIGVAFLAFFVFEKYQDFLALAEYRSRLSQYRAGPGAMIPTGAQLHKIGGLRASKSAEDSLTYLPKALQKNPDDAKLHHHLANLLLMEGEIDRAEPMFRKALSLEGYDAEALNGLAVIAFERRRYNEAIGYLQHALQLKPDFTEAFYNLAIVLEHSNQKEAAIETWRRFLRELNLNQDSEIVQAAKMQLEELQEETSR